MDQHNLPISTIINVKNGEAHIANCLSNLTFCNDIIVLDNYSNDKTLEIAQMYPNVQIVSHEFIGMGPLRNLASTYAKHDWLLIIDVDEVVSPELVNNIINLDFNNITTIYTILRHNYYNHKLVNTGSWKNDWVYRLYNRKYTSFNSNHVHEKLILPATCNIQKLSGIIYHFPYENITGLVAKMQSYSSHWAIQNVHKKPIVWLIPFRALFTFFKFYILKLGFLDGFAGFIISSYNAMGVFTKHVKRYELATTKKTALVLLYNPQITDYINKINLPHQILILSSITVPKLNTIVPHTVIMVEQEIINNITLINQEEQIDSIDKNLYSLIAPYVSKSITHALTLH